MTNLTKQEMLLAGLCAAKTEPFTPVQIQKLFFIFDQELKTEFQGPLFNFQPYNYGPFDKEVYACLENLSQNGLISIEGDTWKTNRLYRLTEKGFQEGKKIFDKFPPKIQNYMQSVSDTVRRLSFSELVSAIYKRYPDMKANSVFNS